jgi:diguanylate cyclase (GGDEF)-like protein
LIPPAGNTEQRLKQGDKQKHGDQPPAESPPDSHSANEIADSASVMGMPLEEFTPRVQEALSAILSQFDCQRAELEQRKAHEIFLESEADKHAFLPVPNRRAFRRSLAQVLARMEQAETSASLAVVVISNLGELRLRYGRRAAEAALSHFATGLKNAVRSSDFVGSLGGDELGLILTLIGAEEAVQKIKKITGQAAGRLFYWSGETISLDAVFGIHAFAARATLAEVIEAADPANMPKSQLSGDDVGE